MEEKMVSQKELSKILGDSALTEMILNRERKLTLDVIRKLHKTFKEFLPLDILITEY